MTLTQPDRSSSTLIERRHEDTAGTELAMLSHVRDLRLLARRVIQENVDVDQTVEMANRGDLEVNLLALNRKTATRLPPMFLDLRSDERDRFISLQKWECYVLEVYADSFAARLLDLTNPGPEEEAVFPMRRVSAEDRWLVRTGAVFYWNIGEHTDVTGRQRTVSELRFRRLPALTNDDIAAARREGKELHDWLTGESSKG
ncbi:MAG: hypothetical protein AAB676_20220 [Verrucomicrobiota bacterium]